MICQQCGTENANTHLYCLKCGKSLRSDSVKGVVTCKNHGNRAAATICDQCLKPICEECVVIQSSRTLCVEDAAIDLVEAEDDRVENLAIADPSVALHAGFATRLFSGAIDLFVVILAAVLLVSLFWLVSGTAPVGLVRGSSQLGEELLFWAAYLAVVVTYFVLLTASEGQTLGKQAMRITVVLADGTTPSVGTAAVRFVYSLFSCVCLGAGFIAIINNSEKQAWHDAWANTYVISLDEATERL